MNIIFRAAFESGQPDYGVLSISAYTCVMHASNYVVLCSEKCATSQWQVHPVAMTTDERFVAANALLQQVDANIVKTAMLRREMPLKCAKLLARQCRLQMQSLVSIIVIKMNS